jgi:hypothetical protein
MIFKNIKGFHYKVKAYCLLIKSESTRGFNLKSSYSYSMNDEKFISS